MSNNVFGNTRREEDDNESSDSSSYPCIFDLHFTKSNTKRRLGKTKNTANSKTDEIQENPSQFLSASNSDSRTHPINTGGSSNVFNTFGKNCNNFKLNYNHAQSVEKIDFNQPNYKSVDQCKKNLLYDVARLPDREPIRSLNPDILATRKKYPLLVSGSSQNKENVVPSDNFSRLLKPKGILNLHNIRDEVDFPTKNQSTYPFKEAEKKVESMNQMVDRLNTQRDNAFYSNHDQVKRNTLEPCVTTNKETFKLPTVSHKTELNPNEKINNNSDSSPDSSMFKTAVLSNSGFNFDDPLDLSNHSMHKSTKDTLYDSNLTKSDMELMDCTKTTMVDNWDCSDMSIISIHPFDIHNKEPFERIPPPGIIHSNSSEYGHQPSMLRTSNATPISNISPSLVPSHQEETLVKNLTQTPSGASQTNSVSENFNTLSAPQKEHINPNLTNHQRLFAHHNNKSQYNSNSMNSTPIGQTQSVPHHNSKVNKIQNENTPIFKRPFSVSSQKQSLSENRNIFQQDQLERPRSEPLPPKSILKKPIENNLKDDLLKVNDKQYKVLTVLGKGGSSSVYLVQENTDNEFKMMALKVVNLSTITDKCIADGYLNEVELLYKLQGCPCVVTMYDYEYETKSKYLYVLMEKGDSDLSKYMKTINKMSTITNATFIIIKHWYEMLLAVKEIHLNGIIHSDLKPANFLFVQGVLKIIDFGIASSIQGDMTSVHKETTTGTLNYMSPEAIRNSSTGNQSSYRITYKSDIWSLGCILYNMIYGKTPYSHIANPWAKMQAIADYGNQIEFKLVLENQVPIPPTLLKSMKLCLQKDPNLRPTAVELLNMIETRGSEF